MRNDQPFLMRERFLISTRATAEREIGNLSLGFSFS
jgi:hypothetical protein